MDKALVIVSENNKGKYISKGFSDALRGLYYFVVEKKVYDLNIEEIEKYNPDIVLIFWTDLSQKDIVTDFVQLLNTDKTIFIHIAESLEDIPKNIKRNKQNHIYTCDSKTMKNKYILSVNPKEYKTRFSGYKYSITFCGNPAIECRERLLVTLICNFGAINIFSRSYDFYKSVDEIEKNNLLTGDYLELYRKSYRGQIDSQKDLAHIYSASKINIDMPSKYPKGINYRSLEIMASGGFLIAPHNENIVKYFDDGADFETYKTDYELTDKINFYLKNLNITKAIAEKGKRTTVNSYSFYDRLKSMLKVIYGKDFGNR